MSLTTCQELEEAERTYIQNLIGTPSHEQLQIFATVYRQRRNDPHNSAFNRDNRAGCNPGSSTLLVWDKLESDSYSYLLGDYY